MFLPQLSRGSLPLLIAAGLALAAPLHAEEAAAPLPSTAPVNPLKAMQARMSSSNAPEAAVMSGSVTVDLPQDLTGLKLRDVSGKDLGPVVDLVRDKHKKDAAGEAPISHVLVDLGGFMGIGAHRVAVPVSALSMRETKEGKPVARLPWSREQLESVPAYNPDDPDSLGLRAGDEAAASLSSPPAATQEASVGDQS